MDVGQIRLDAVNDALQKIAARLPAGMLKRIPWKKPPGKWIGTSKMRHTMLPGALEPVGSNFGTRRAIVHNKRWIPDTDLTKNLNNHLVVDTSSRVIAPKIKGTPGYGYYGAGEHTGNWRQAMEAQLANKRLRTGFHNNRYVDSPGMLNQNALDTLTGSLSAAQQLPALKPIPQGYGYR